METDSGMLGAMRAGKSRRVRVTAPTTAPLTATARLTATAPLPYGRGSLSAFECNEGQGAPNVSEGSRMPGSRMLATRIGLNLISGGSRRGRRCG